MNANRIIIATAVLLVSHAASANWTAKRVFEPVKNEQRCVLESTTQTMHDGHQDTEIFLRLDSESLLVMTRSNIDAGKSDIGLQVGSREFIKMDKVYLDQNALFETEIAKIITQFKKGLRARFQLRFWPTYPDTGTHTITFSLIGFTKAYAGLHNCE